MHTLLVALVLVASPVGDASDCAAEVPEQVLGVYLNVDPVCVHQIDRVDGHDCDRTAANWARVDGAGQSRVEITLGLHGPLVEAEQRGPDGGRCWRVGEARWERGKLRFPVGDDCVLGLSFDEWGVVIDAPRGCRAGCQGTGRWGGLVRRRSLPWNDTGAGRKYPAPPAPPRIFRADAAAASSGELVEEQVQRAGRWRAIVRYRGRPHPRLGFRAERSEVLRQGPRDPEPVLLRREEGIWRQVLRLREDGLLLASGRDEAVQLFFPGASEPLTVELPAAQDGKRHDFLGLEKAYFLDDLILYDRASFSDPYRMIGWIRVDVPRRRVVDQGVILEDGAPDGATVQTSGLVEGTAFRGGDHLFWLNEGYRSDWHPDAVQGPWTARRMRAWDMRAGAFVDADRVPIAVLRRAAPALRAWQDAYLATAPRECIRWVGWALERLRWAPGWEARDAKARCRGR